MAYYYNNEPVTGDSQTFDYFKYNIDGFNEFCKEHYKKIKKDQEFRVSKTKRKEFYAESPAPTFPEENFVWSDKDPRFRYFRKHIPILDVRDTMKVRVTAFRGVDDIRCQLITKEAKHFRDLIDKGLQEYCSTAAADPNFWPVPGQIFFVHVRPLMSSKYGTELQPPGKAKWKTGWLAEDSDDDEEQKEAQDEMQQRDPIWMRAECQSYVEKANQMSIYLIDTGESVKYNLSSEQIRRAVLRYVSLPACSANVMIALEKPIQYTKELTEKWRKLIRRGMNLLLKLCGVCNGRYMTRLMSPTEYEVEYLYISERLHDGKKDTTHDSAPDPAVPWKYSVKLGLHTLRHGAGPLPEVPETTEVKEDRSVVVSEVGTDCAEDDADEDGNNEEDEDEDDEKEI